MSVKCPQGAGAMRNALHKIRQHWHVAWLPPWNPHKTKPAAMLSLDWAAVRNGASPHFSHQVRVACSDPFFGCLGHYPPVEILCHLCKVSGPQCMDVKNVQKWVRKFMYGCTDVHDEQRSGRPSVSAKTIAKVEQEQEMLEDECVTVRELYEWIPEVKSTIGNVVGEFYDKGVRKMPQHMQKCINRNSDYVKNSWKSDLSINVTLIANKHVFICEKKLETLFCGHASYFRLRIQCMYRVIQILDVHTDCCHSRPWLACWSESGPLYSRCFQTLTQIFQFIFPVDGHVLRRTFAKWRRWHLLIVIIVIR